ncbi:MAG: hypothetical protein JRD89_03085 [Deltaproteobacteria bacterium]|nr:hypothetical protein [Deltaproteobacteria bacterium]
MDVETRFKIAVAHTWHRRHKPARIVVHSDMLAGYGGTDYEGIPIKCDDRLAPGSVVVDSERTDAVVGISNSEFGTSITGMPEKKQCTVGQLRGQTALSDAAREVVVVTMNRETGRMGPAGFRVASCYPDTTDEHGEWRSVFKIELVPIELAIAAKGSP